ncbi:hypothetical protein IQ255_12225 [Pleurocapsales cyanobacterium LEGE 10410]|nr:hypothetical protein [Pleurocapsales cyanobacterium LEGE 10410]
MNVDNFWQCGEIIFSPDGQLLASPGFGAIPLWQIPDGKLLTTFTPHSDRIGGISFSPDRQLLASFSYDKTIKLWSLDLLDLPRLIELPIKRLCQQDRKYIEKTLQNKKITEEKRYWLEFMQALMDWYQRFDVEVKDVPQLVNTGEFDIEIEG